MDRTSSQPDGSALTGEELNAICQRFEAAWQSLPPPDLERFLPAPPAQRLPALVELIAIDLEYRWKLADALDTVNRSRDDSAGTEASLPVRPRLEDYLWRYREAGPADAPPLVLIAAEYRVRAGLGDRPAHAEYAQRFPGHGPALRTELEKLDRELAKEMRREVRRPTVETPPPTHWGRYQVTDRLGAGGFGVVYRGYDPELRRHVAIKVPRADRLTSEADAEAYLAEARTVASLDHPGIVPVYDLGRAEGGLCYVVSKFIPGGRLTDLVAPGPLPPERAAEIILLVAEALQYAHRRGVVHRDIKPANILLDEAGRPQVADFGLALKDEDYARGPHLCGTPVYMSPEQARGEGHRVDARSDIYSLGIVFYELLTGRHPYRSANASDILDEIASSDVRPPRQLNEHVPKKLERVCLKATARSLTERYTTAGDLADDLRPWLAQQRSKRDRETPGGAARPRRAAAVAPAAPGEATPVTDSKVRRHNLPQQVTSFVGREKELAEVRRLLATTPLLTLTGVGGAGKTRLSQRVAAEVLVDYADGVWLVELAPLADAALVPQAVAKAFALREAAGQSLVDTLLVFLESKQLLLLLDNCEHLVEACAQLAERVVTHCPGVRVLATSREALHVAGELAWRVPSLPLPDAAAGQAPEELLASEAVRLFHDRARACRPEFSLNEENAAAVAQICRRLDGIPLAIELAAARVTVLSPKQICQRLDDRFRLLTSGSRAALPRQKTLEATIVWSYDLLEVAERELFCRLSVFAGDFALEAVEAVCSGDGIDSGQVLDLLDHLTEKSLVATTTTKTGEVRYRLLETLKAYAGQRLTEQGRTDALSRRHVEYYLRIAQEARPGLEAGRQVEWLKWWDLEVDNLRFALAWAFEHDPVSAMRLADASACYWELRCCFAEARTLVQRALAVGRDGPAELQANLLRWAAHLADRQGDWDDCATLARRCLEVSRQCAYERGVGMGLYQLGTAAWRASDYEAARSYLEESLTIRRKLGDKAAIAATLNNLCIVAVDQADYVRGKPLLEEGLAIDREIGNLSGQSIKLYNLGIQAFRQGEYRAAIWRFEESLNVERILGLKRGRAMSLYMLGWSFLRLGERDKTLQYCEESLRLSREVGEKCEASWATKILGFLAFDCQDYARARALYTESLRERHAICYTFGFPLLFEALAKVEAVEGATQKAARLFGAAHALRKAIRTPLFPCDQADYERYLALVRDALGPGAFQAEWHTGAAMTTDAAVAFALGESTAS